MSFLSYQKLLSGSEMLGKYFSLAELIRSNTAISRRIDNTPDPKVKKNLVKLVKEYLDPLREYLGVPIKINVGYRSVMLNYAIGGESTSAHLYGCAVDIVAPMSPAVLCAKINQAVRDKKIPPYDQLIRYNSKGFVHFGINRPQDADKSPRRQFLDGDDGYKPINA